MLPELNPKFTNWKYGNISLRSIFVKKEPHLGIIFLPYPIGPIDIMQDRGILQFYTPNVETNEVDI